MNGNTEQESLSLSELNRLIGSRIKKSMPEAYWVAAEINEMHVAAQGHCFLELIEKETTGDRITAKIRANIWAYHFRMLRPYFETTTGQSLAPGLKVMLCVSVEFHELYGLSLQVTDINPAFTVGDLAMRKMAVIRQLTDEGIIDMNRELDVPLVPQRIAVISSETAAGYGDFINQLHRNPYGYAFRHTLFPAVVQGREAEASVIDALDRIFEREEEFDVVVMIRGGGAQSDLNCFNAYRLACCMAQFPLPVITGIGHDRDETIADRVACIPLKTPTAVAEYLIGRALEFDRSLRELALRLAEAAEACIGTPADRLIQQSRRLQTALTSFVHARDKEMEAYRFRLARAAADAVARQRYRQSRLSDGYSVGFRKTDREQNARLTELRQKLGRAAENVSAAQKVQIARAEDRLRLLDPSGLLQRGYSVTLVDGRVARAGDLKKGQRIETVLYDGRVKSIVEESVSNRESDIAVQ